MNNNNTNKKPNHPERKRQGGQKKWKKVDKTVKAVEESVLREVAKENESPLEMEMRAAKALKLANDIEELTLEQQLKKHYLQQLANDSFTKLETGSFKVSHDFMVEEAKEKAASEYAAKILHDAKAQAIVARLAVRAKEQEEKLAGLTYAPKVSMEVKKFETQEHEVAQQRHRVEAVETVKNVKAETDLLVVDKEKDTKVNLSKLELYKSAKQLEETKLRDAPLDQYQLESSDDFEFDYKISKFRPNFKPAMFLLFAFTHFLMFAWLDIDWWWLFFDIFVITWTSVLVAFQIWNPLLRYSSGEKTHYFATKDYCFVPGKMLVDGLDVRQENDRRDLVKYEGLVRFFEITRKYVGPIKVQGFELHWIFCFGLKRRYVKKTYTAVSVGLLQQVVTKRVSYCEEDHWVRSKFEYNMANMTCVNVDKELMFLRHPVKKVKRGFAVWQDTVDVAWGWFMAQKQYTRNVPRPRAVESQPTSN